MDALLFHPKVVHVPMALGILMPLVSGALLVAWWRQWLPWRAWILALGLQAVLIGSGLAALSTGESEEERVESVVSEALIEAHEEAAEVFVVGSTAVFFVMVAAAALARRGGGLPIAALATAGTVIVLGLGYRTGRAGGALVYQHGAAQAYVPTLGGGARPASQRRVDDD